MKKIIFLLILCLASINIYAQRDTVFCLESNIPTIVMHIVPDSVYNAGATVEQNWEVWTTKKPMTLSVQYFFEYKGLNAHKYIARKILSFDEDTKKCVVLNQTTPKEKYFPWEIVILFIASFFIFIGCFLFYRSLRNPKIYILLPMVIQFVFSLAFSFIFLGIFFFNNNGITEPAMPIVATVLGLVLALVFNFYIKKKDKKQEKEHSEVGGDMCG